MSKKPLLLIPLLAAVGGGAYLWTHRAPPTDPNHLTLYGNVEIREAQLTFNASDHVAQVLVQEGDHVQPRQVLARLHTPLLRAEVAQAAATVEAAHQQLIKLQAGSRPEEIDKGRAELAAAKARARAAADTYKRLDGLLHKKLASEEQVETAQAQAEATRADVQAAEQALALLVAGPRTEDIAVARAELAARQANLDLARERLADAELTAPAAGVIRNRILEPGDMASPQRPAMTLAFTDPVWVRTYVPETELGRIHPGMAARIRTDSYPGKSYAGWIGYVSPTAEFTPRNVETPELRTRLVYSMRVFACNPQDELRLGMPATVDIDLNAKATDTTPPCATQP